MVSFNEALAATYSRSMQIGSIQLQAIAGAIHTRSPGCNLLIFGCGHDSALWAELNRGGRTVFMETSPEWRARILKEHPQLDIRLYKPGADRNVTSSLHEIRDPQEPIPSELLGERWDVIIVDGPEGWKPDSPGRAAEIAWAARLRHRNTHVFIDDYNRPLEKAYADTLHRYGERCVLPNRSKKMLWVAGKPAAISAGTDLMPITEERAARKGCVIFLLDRNYLLPLKVFAHSIRAALRNTARDILVITNDRAVAEDRFINAAAERVILLSDREIAEVAKVKRDRVRSAARHNELGKYTFLKFLCFDDLGYRDHIFMDADMLCLDANFRLEELESDVDFAAALTIGAHRLGIQHLSYRPQSDSNELPAEVRQLVKQKYLKIARTSRASINSFNSGVFFAGPRLLSSLTRERMIETATRFSFALEQQVSLAVLSDCEGLRWKNLPIAINAPVFPLYAMGHDNFEEVRKYVRIIHYNGDRKPWQIERENSDWLERLWWDTHAAALEWAAAVERFGPGALRAGGVAATKGWFGAW